MGNRNVVQPPNESQLENEIVTLNIYVLGETYVGKTCLARTYESGVFEENTEMRMGSSWHVRRLKIQNIDAKLSIWNVSGQESFRKKFVPFYLSFHDVESALLLYDIARLPSYHVLPMFLEIVREVNPEAIIFIIGARCDLVDKREVPREMGQEFACSENLEFFECSAKTGENVNEIFEHMALKLLQKKGLIPPDPDEKEIIIEEKIMETKEEEEVEEKLNTSLTEEEPHGCASKKDPSKDFQKSFQDNDSGVMEQGLGTLNSTIQSAESLNSDPGLEGCQMLTYKDLHESSQSDINKPSELSETCLSLDDQEDLVQKTAKPVPSEEEMLLQGKCPAGDT